MSKSAVWMAKEWIAEHEGGAYEVSAVSAVSDRVSLCLNTILWFSLDGCALNVAVLVIKDSSSRRHCYTIRPSFVDSVVLSGDHSSGFYTALSDERVEFEDSGHGSLVCSIL